MKANKDTIIRTIVLVLALVNQVLTVLGKNPLPFSDQAVYEAISLIFTVGTSLIAWWKNNSFTKEAIQADKYLNKLRGAGK